MVWRVPLPIGDLATSLLALLAIATLGSRLGSIIVWMFNIVGTVDLLNAFYQGNRLGVGITPSMQGAALFISTVLVPLLLVTHVLVFRSLLAEPIQGSVGRVADARTDRRLHQSPQVCTSGCSPPQECWNGEYTAYFLTG